MTTTHTNQTPFQWPTKGKMAGKQLALLALLFTAFSCSHSGQSDVGAKKRLKVSVGEIKEVSLPNRGEAGSELIGTSDNQEVVEVSRRQLAPAVDTLNRINTGPTVFQIKGVTVGTANVTFSTRAMTASGNGQPVRTYVVQVTAK
ncbi:hypothetical protein Slin_0483 [Spirosoma linguale DSM 74]|uniref:Uncharacterized protein n=2 Tax=Spirosoma TaxID=107 RepID=D2QF70_SPILD|nr:hypothetical protein Slin_0483 [Spirosoma linguale DSM 74]